MSTPPTPLTSDQKTARLNSILLGICGLLGAAIVAAMLILKPLSPGGDGRKTQALSNIKQTATAINIYTQDNDERLPPAAKWMDVIKPYVKDEEILKSTLATPDITTDYGFAFREEFSLKPLEDFSDPELQAMLFDSTILSRNAHSGLETMPKPGRYGEDKDTGNLVAFIDSSAKFIRDDAIGKPSPNGKPLIK